MSNRKKNARSSKATSSMSKKVQSGSSAESLTNDGDEDAGTEGASSKGSLKDFVKKMEGSSHRVVEMRLAVVGACGVAFRVLIYDDLDGSERTAWSVLALVAVSLLVVIFSTWLDYFPSRLSHLQLRQAEGQGMALGCLLVPTLCCASIHCSLYITPDHVGLLSTYLLLLCSLSFLSLCSTLLHSIAFPNNITFYNFVAAGVTFALYYWLNAPYWLLLPCIAIYSVLVPWLLHTFPSSFTVCEAMITSQGLTLLVTDTALQLLAMNDLVVLSDMFSVHRHQALLYVEFLLFGVILCCILLSPALYKVAKAKNYLDLKFWSGTFILLSLSVGVLLVLRWLQTQLGGHHPIALVLVETFTRPLHLFLMLYWLAVTVVTLVLVSAQSSEARWLAPLRVSNPSSMLVRKSFHVLAVLVYLPGLAVDPDYLALGTALITFLSIVLELLRYFHMWPGGESLHATLQPLLDTRDSGPLLLSHLYLLFGLSLPLWVSPLRHQHQVGKLALYSGVLALGVGDSMAAAAGSLMGKTRWPGTRKTVEGSTMSVLTQLVVIVMIVLVDIHVPMPSLREWGVIGGSLVATGLLEAYTWQIDNLVLALFQLAFFLAFI